MGDAAQRNEARKSDHRQVRVADDPVRKVDEAIDGHQRLHRTLQTHHQVSDDTKPDETQRDVLRSRATVSAQGK